MKKWWLLLPAVLLSWGVALPAQAICPVCTGVVVVGLGVSRWLGVDDSITGIWIGAFIVMVSLWTLSWLKKKGIQWPFKKLSVWLVYAVLVLGGLYLNKSFGHSLNQLWGVDRLLLGIIVGVGVTYSIIQFYYWIKKRYHGKAHFPFQRTVMSLGSLIIVSIIFYFISK
ncbi:MAG: hypothetical protein V1719_01335 [Patescibacteria group bacterium]